MDEMKLGTRTKRGDYTPNTPLTAAPLFHWPVQPMTLICWLPQHFPPWNTRFFRAGDCTLALGHALA